MLLMSRSCSSIEGRDEKKMEEMGWGYGDEEENEEEAHGDERVGRRQVWKRQDVLDKQ